MKVRGLGEIASLIRAAGVDIVVGIVVGADDEVRAGAGAGVGVDGVVGHRARRTDHLDFLAVVVVLVGGGVVKVVCV